MIQALRAFGPMVRYSIKAYYHSRRTGRLLPEVRDAIVHDWGRATVNHLGMELQVLGQEPMKRPGLLVGNHLSYLDIPLICAALPVLFVAKKEILSWPMVGRVCKLINLIFIDRDSKESRSTVADQVVSRILTQSDRFVVFPSGTTCLDEKKPWRRKLFHIASEHQFYVQPFRIAYKPLREAAFIDDDTLLPHLSRLLKVPSLQASLEFAEPRLLTQPKEEMLEIQKWCQNAVVGKP